MCNAGSLRFLALHNFETPFMGELASVLAGFPHLEELYLASFRVATEQPLNFTKLWLSVQNLRTLVLDVRIDFGFEGDGFEAPVCSLPQPVAMRAAPSVISTALQKDHILTLVPVLLSCIPY